MERWKTILKKLLWPGRRWVILMVLLSAAALFLAFETRLRDTPFPYAAYCLSAYGLTVFVAAIVPALRQAPRFLHNIPLAHRYMTDKYFSVWYGLAISFLINLGFAVLKLVYAVWYDNAMAENFFSILKCECIYRRKPQTRAQAKKMIDEFI